MKRNVNETSLRPERRVISVRSNGEDLFFGSISAIFERFSEKDLGISYNELRYQLNHKNVFANQYCRIVRGTLEAKRKSAPITVQLIKPKRGRRKKITNA